MTATPLSALPSLAPAADADTRHDPVRVRALGRSTVLLTVSGEIDAASAPRLVDRIERLLAGYHQFVLDLSRVTFFGTAGFSMLRRLDVFATRAAIDWAVVTGTEVQRLLRVCDPDHLVPVAGNIVSAVARLARGPHRTPQLVAVR